MKRLLGFWSLVLIAGCLGMGFRMAETDAPDLSTPQKSFAAFVDILKSGDMAALGKVATPTGRVSLASRYEGTGERDGMIDLGLELADAKPKWEEITEEIYFASAQVGGNLHKMEFTKEEPGWMLYHWQIGGGAGSSENEPQFDLED
ncbi:MAG: hypothetical protein U0176_18425 [Bacteroidia bacterium]